MAITPIVINYDNKIITTGKSGDKITLHVDGKRLNDDLCIQAAEIDMAENYDGAVAVESMEAR